MGILDKLSSKDFTTMNLLPLITAGAAKFLTSSYQSHLNEQRMMERVLIDLDKSGIYKIDPRLSIERNFKKATRYLDYINSPYKETKFEENDYLTNTNIGPAMTFGIKSNVEVLPGVAMSSEYGEYTGGNVPLYKLEQYRKDKGESSSKDDNKKDKGDKKNKPDKNKWEGAYKNLNESWGKLNKNQIKASDYQLSYIYYDIEHGDKEIYNKWKSKVSNKSADKVRDEAKRQFELKYPNNTMFEFNW